MQILPKTKSKYEMIKKSDRGPILLYITGAGMNKGYEEFCERIAELSGTEDFSLAVIEVEDWNGYLSPWRFETEDRKMSFAGKAEELVEDINLLRKDILINCSEIDTNEDQIQSSEIILGGYSLAGLFCLWSAYRELGIKNIVCGSGSVWYPGFYEYTKSHTLPENARIYLSLGTKEEKTRHPYMSKVGDVMRQLSTDFEADERVVDSVLEWNPGNHFNEPQERMARGFAFLLKPPKK